MRAYEPLDNSHVGALIAWWSVLPQQDRDLAFRKEQFDLSAFLSYFNSRQADLMFEVDTKGVWIAVWTSRLLDAASFSCWIRADRRHSPSAWRELRTAYEAVFQVYPTVLNITRQPKLHATHLKLGYVYCGKLDAVSNDGPIYLYEMTRTGWQNRAERARSVREIKRTARELRLRRQNGVPKSPEPAIIPLEESAAVEDETGSSWMRRAYDKLGLN